MKRTTTAPLRASCERCRAQKLRCVPSSVTDCGAPCQRCVRAKVSETCVFGPRSQTGRTGRGTKCSGNVESRPGTSSRRDKETSMPALPGMSTFALSGSSSPEARSPDSLGSLSTRQTSQILGIHEDTAALDCTLESGMSDFWQRDAKSFDSLSLDAYLQQPSQFLFEANESTFIDEVGTCGQGDGITASMEESYSVDNGAHIGFNAPSTFFSNTPQAGDGGDTDMLADEKPGPLVDLTALLAEMSPYEGRLSKLSGSELHNFPIGDALYFSHRFYAILSDYSHLPSTDSTSPLNTPTMLLALSCFMTLTRNYSLIFGHLHEQLSRMLKARSAQKSKSCAFPSMGRNIHSYRGLRLSQLQPICLCAGWDPVKKAVSMLLNSLGGAERWLGLPYDVRVIAASGAEAQGEQTPRSGGFGGEKTTLFEEGSMAALTNGRLYKTVRTQAKELREKIEEVEELLKATTDIGHLLGA